MVRRQQCSSVVVHNFVHGTVKALKCIGVVVKKVIIVDGAYQLH